MQITKEHQTEIKKILKEKIPEISTHLSKLVVSEKMNPGQQQYFYMRFATVNAAIVDILMSLLGEDNLEDNTKMMGELLHDANKEFDSFYEEVLKRYEKKKSKIIKP